MKRVTRDRPRGEGFATVLSSVLAGGLTVSVALLLAGVVLSLVRSDLPVARVTSVRGLASGLTEFEPGAFFTLGLVVLLFTPAARVAIQVVGFAHARRWGFSALATAVLAFLGLSVFLGIWG